MRGQGKVLSSQQRYQKTRNFSAQIFAGRAALGTWLALSVGLVGCAGAQAPGIAEPAATEIDLRQSLVPPNTTRPITEPGAPQSITLFTPPAARQAVVDARDAMQKKQWTRLAGLIPTAKADPLLGAYAQYWLLRAQLQDSTQPVPDEQLQQFLAVNQDAYLADRLTADWVVAAAGSGNYALAARLGPVVATNAHVQCSQLLAQHMTGQTVTAARAMAAFQPNPSCWSMLDQLYSRNVVGWKHLEPELRAILETNKTGNAQRLAAVMFDGTQMVSYAALMKDPKKWLTGRAAPKSRADTELVTLALSRLARGKDRSANAAYIESQWAAAIPKANLEWVWGQFGLVAALNVEPDALQWYRRSGNTPMTDYNHAWRVRAELRAAPIDWAWVAKSINKMPAKQAAEPVWVYWYARALAAQGNKQAAEQHFTSIAHELNFYGQLASEELGRTLTLPPAPNSVTAAELAEARANPGLQRAIELFRLGWRPEAVPEWNFALRGMKDRQLLAAAELARQENIYDRVVNTSLQTREEIDFSQRFIAPFEGRVTQKAKLIDLDPAWVYGLIRQESRFITDARSHVGASGLMQLMPATARWVARKIGMKDFTPSSVNDFDTNTILGTSYLSMVLNDLDGSEVLATAGYNAGPGRPVQWRAKLAGPVEGAIFAETIPFTETRLYVKNVMSNAIYYAMMFTGKSHSLKERLGTISPVAARRIDLP
jgi:soluble lytic murein transglycosylase